MINRLTLGLVAAAATVIMAGSVHAATLTVSQGPCFLNTGTGYQPVSGSVEIKAGDRVICRGAGSAQIAYSPTNVVTVTSANPAIVQVVAAGGGLGVTEALVLGGVAVAGGVAAAVSASSGSKSP